MKGFNEYGILFSCRLSDMKNKKSLVSYYIIQRAVYTGII